MYYDNGQIWEKGTYKNGKLVGEYTLYYQNGEILSKKRY